MSIWPAKRFSRSGWCALLVFAAPLGAHAQVDFSDDYLNPTQFVLGEGIQAYENTVQSSGSNDPGADVDFFTVVVNPGLQIDRIELTRYEGPAVSLIGFGAGATLTADPSAGTASQLQFATDTLGYALVGEELLGSNLMRNLADGDVTIDRVNDPPDLQLAMNRRFDPNQPLGAGSYAFVFQDTGPFLITYEVAFFTSAVPEPNTMLILALGAAFGLVRSSTRGR